MDDKTVDWQTWCGFFAMRSGRGLPGLHDPYDYSGIPDSFARSLAIFQLGESGGGTIVDQARNSRIRTAGGHYAEAMQLFVAEEHRHAAILAICVRNLGGSLIRRNWTADLFVFGRRLLGLRLKVLVLLAAEVVGICYYHLLATRLPASRLRSLLELIVNDERSHLHFHCSFLRAEARSPWRRFIFIAVWRLTMLAAAIVTLIDHRGALRDLGLPAGTVWRRWMTYRRLAERLITWRDAGTDADREILDRRQAAYPAGAYLAPDEADAAPAAVLSCATSQFTSSISSSVPPADCTCSRYLPLTTMDGVRSTPHALIQ